MRKSKWAIALGFVVVMMLAAFPWGKKTVVPVPQDQAVIRAATGGALRAKTAGFPNRAGRVGLEDLLQSGANPNARDWQREKGVSMKPPLGTGLLSDLIGQWRVRSLKANEYDTALIVATRSGPLHAVQSLLKHGANPNLTGAYRYTALHYATMVGNQAKAGALVAAGADVNARSATGATPLSLAVVRKNRAMITFLKTSGAK